MTHYAIIENKISHVRKYLKILERYQKQTQKEIETHVDLRGAVERYLYLVTQATIDLAEAVISFKGFRKPTTLGETFRILTEEKIIGIPLLEKMIQLTGFRNVIAHDYEDINYDILYKVLQNGLNDICQFLEQITKI
jgi:uncharacterized protein YutE (UPF0331/DUF86 family)